MNERYRYVTVEERKEAEQLRKKYGLKEPLPETWLVRETEQEKLNREAWLKQGISSCALNPITGALRL